MSEFAEQYGPWALVAGASDGVGSAMAAELARRGLNVALLPVGKTFSTTWRPGSGRVRVCRPGRWPSISPPPTLPTT